MEKEGIVQTVKTVINKWGKTGYKIGWKRH